MKDKKTILIVDDDQNIVEVLKVRLEGLGLNVIYAYDGIEGFNLAKEKKPDLIFLDVVMPKMDGTSTLLKLKGDPETASIPVIMLSGIVEKEEMRITESLGAADYIGKPFSHEEIVSKINKLFEIDVSSTEDFYSQAVQKIRAMVSIESRGAWSGFIEEYFKDLNSFLEKNKLSLFIRKFKDFSQNYTFYHALNISCMSMQVGKDLELGEERLKNLATMSLLHEQEAFNISLDLLNSLYKEDLEAQKIIKVTDVFDTFINPPPYRESTTNWSALEVMMTIGKAEKHIFDPDVVKSFIKVITIYPVGTWVSLSNGFIGKVEEVNRDNIFRPRIEVVANTNGNNVKPFIVDLSNNQIVKIKEVLSDAEVKNIINV